MSGLVTIFAIWLEGSNNITIDYKKKYYHDDTKKYMKYQQIELLVMNILKNTLINKKERKEYFKE